MGQDGGDVGSMCFSPNKIGHKISGSGPLGGSSNGVESKLYQRD